MILRWLKGRTIKCEDCREQIEQLTPNHKRCAECARKQRIKVALTHRCSPEENRRRAKDWYYRNRDYKLTYMRKKYGTP